MSPSCSASKGQYPGSMPHFFLPPRKKSTAKMIFFTAELCCLGGEVGTGKEKLLLLLILVRLVLCSSGVLQPQVDSAPLMKVSWAICC